MSSGGQHIAKTIIYTSNGISYSTTMYDAQYATKGPRSGRRWYVCHRCDFSYPEDQIIKYGATPYCIPRGCYLDRQRGE